GLGRRHADLGARVDVHTAVRQERDARADDVHYADRQGAALQAVPQRHERVGRLARLRHEDARVVAEDGRLAIQEIRRQLDGDGYLGQLLEHAAHRHAAVVRRAAGDKDDAAAAADGTDVVAQAA